MFAQALSTRLREIPRGTANATRYHHLAMAICTFLFYPQLSCPLLEHEIHEGRKRIDIKYTNSATNGFFAQMLQSPATCAIDVLVECKNYQNEIANPELDQMSGRFSPHRGRFGLLLCRSIDNRVRFIKRCRDTALDDRGYIIVLEDLDLHELLNLVARHNRRGIDEYMRRRYGEIT